MSRLANIPLSILDLVALRADETSPAPALQRALAQAQQAEQLGFLRYWVAEHHNMPGLASSATAVLLGYLAAGTSTLRLGSGGIMLPNHAPLVIAEQFGTLAALYPGRIELGLGRTRAAMHAPPAPCGARAAAVRMIFHRRSANCRACSDRASRGRR